MSILTQVQTIFESSVVDPADADIWAEVKRKGQPAEITLRNTYRGYAYNGHFFYLDKGDRVKACELNKPGIRSSIVFTGPVPVTEAKPAVSFTSRAMGAFNRITGKAEVLKAAYGLYQVLCNRKEQTAKGPLSAAAGAYGIRAKDLQRYISQHQQ